MNRKSLGFRLTGLAAYSVPAPCSTWNISGMTSQFGTVPRGTNWGQSPFGTIPIIDQIGNKRPNNSESPQNPTQFPGLFHRLPFFTPMCPFGCLGMQPLTPHPFPIDPYPSPPDAFHSFVSFSTAPRPTPVSLVPFSLDCHGKDSRRCQPKGRGWQNHHCN